MQNPEETVGKHKQWKKVRKFRGESKEKLKLFLKGESKGRRIEIIDIINKSTHGRSDSK